MANILGKDTVPPKNKLQEYFQRNQLSLPNYQQIRCGGQDHVPLWKTKVILYDGREFTGDIFSTKSAADNSAALKALEYINSIITVPVAQISTPIRISVELPPKRDVELPPKRDVELPVRRDVKLTKSSDNISMSSKIAVLSPIDTSRNLNNSAYRNSNKTAILVDIENMPKFIDSIGSRINEFTVYAFIGEHHCLVDKPLPTGVIKIVSPSTRSDGTDTTIQMYVGMLLAKNMYDKYYIVTRDHFGSALVEMISAPGLGWIAKPAKLITNCSQL